MPTNNLLKGIFLVLGIAHVLALIVLAFLSFPSNLAESAGYFSIILLVECAICFVIAAAGGITVPTKRMLGDKDPSHYRHDTWTGGGGFSADSPAFLASGAILFLESLTIGVMMTV